MPTNQSDRHPPTDGRARTGVPLTLSFLSLAFEGLVAVLLAITIFFAIKLNRRLTLLRNREADMQRMIDRFDQAAARAEASAAHLKHIGGDTEKSLRDSIGAAKALRDDLAFMVERADVFARQLDRERAGDQRPPSPPPSAPASRTLQPAGPRRPPRLGRSGRFRLRRRRPRRGGARGRVEVRTRIGEGPAFGAGPRGWKLT